jgi:hypothetical protein
MSRRRRHSRTPAKKVATESFWGEADKGSTPKRIRPTPDPTAIPRSLGSPPLVSATVQQQLAIVYEEAVRAATALAAANGLLEEEN